MSFADRPPTLSRRRSSAVSGAWWVARWLLVLVLALDTVSAPFHHHRHEGVDGPLEVATGLASFDAGATHAEGDEHAHASHSVMAIRVDPSRLGRLAAGDRVDAPVATASASELLAALDTPAPTHWRPDRPKPDLRSHRSLPPAGRAPPLPT